MISIGFRGKKKVVLLSGSNRDSKTESYSKQLHHTCITRGTILRLRIDIAFNVVSLQFVFIELTF